MALSEIERKIAEQVKSQGGTKEDFIEVLQEYRKRQPKQEVKEAPVETTPQVVAPVEEKVSGLDIGVKAGKTVQKLGESLKFTKAKEGDSPLKSVAKFVGNIPGGAIEIIGETTETLSDPLGTIKGLKTVGETGIESGLNKIFSTKIGQSILKKAGVSDDKLKAIKQGGLYTKPELKQTAEGIKNTVIENFGTLEKARQTIVNNPEDVIGLFVGTKGVGKGTGVVKPSAKKIKELRKQADIGVEQFIKPTKETTKQITKDITPGILQRGIKGTREEVFEQSQKKLDDIGKEIEDFIVAGKTKGEIDLDKLVDTLAKADKELRIDGVLLAGRESQANYINKQLDFLGELQKKYGKTLPADKQIELKRSFDTVFDKAVTRDKITKYQDDLDVKLADTLRAELAKNNPDLDALNKEYSFYKGLNTVLDETIGRTTGQDVTGLLSTLRQGQQGGIGATIGATIGGSVGGIPGAVIGGTIGGATGIKLQQVISSPKWKLAKAQDKAKLANALAKGDFTTAEKIMNTIIGTSAVQGEE